MKYKVNNRVVLGSVALGLFFAQFSVLYAADIPATPRELSQPQAGDAPAAMPPRELLSQFVNIDRNEFKAKGKITLHRLQPLAGQLTLSFAQGDPEWIFKTIAPWNPSLSRLLQEMKIKELTLSDAALLLDGEQIDLRMNQATIPEGDVEGLTYQKHNEGIWNIQTAKMRLKRVPHPFNQGFLSWVSEAVGFDQMQASGNRQKGHGWAIGLFAQGWRIGRLEGTGEVGPLDKQGRPTRATFAWKAEKIHAPGLQGPAARIPALGEILRFVGKDPKKQEPLTMNQFICLIESVEGEMRIQSMRLEAPWVHISGNGVLEPNNAQKKGRLKLNLTAKRPDGKEKRFMVEIPLATPEGA
ncbi:MAG: hypothetical protein H7839_21610 [Magnetococcus sp. YQC-5]